MITGLSHVSIVVPDLAAALEKMRATYGLVSGQIKVNEGQGVSMTYIDLGNAKIELMEPSRPDSPIAKFLERYPRGGIHHFCLGVDSVEQTTNEPMRSTTRGKSRYRGGRPGGGAPREGEEWRTYRASRQTRKIGCSRHDLIRSGSWLSLGVLRA